MCMIVCVCGGAEGWAGAPRWYSVSVPKKKCHTYFLWILNNREELSKFWMYSRNNLMLPFSSIISLTSEPQIMEYHSPEICNKSVKWLGEKRRPGTLLEPCLLEIWPLGQALQWQCENRIRTQVVSHPIRLLPLSLQCERRSPRVVIFPHGTTALGPRSETTPLV